MIEKFKALRFDQKKKIAALAAALAVLFLGWKILIEKDIRDLKELKHAASENAPKQAVVDETAHLEKKLKNYSDLLSKVRQADWLIDTVNTYAADSGLTLQSVVPQPSRDGEGDYGKIVLTMEAEGTYHNMGHFVEKIENDRPLIKINVLRILRPEGWSGNGLKFTVTVSAFYSKAAAG